MTDESALVEDKIAQGRFQCLYCGEAEAYPTLKAPGAVYRCFVEGVLAKTGGGREGLLPFARVAMGD